MFNLLKRFFFSRRSPHDDRSPLDELNNVKDLRDKFSKIYSDNIFGGKESRSGEGSSMEQTTEIRRELPLLVREFGIESFMDAPCGDFFWMKEVDLGVKRYVGVDIVEALVEKDQQQYGREGRSFQCLNLAEDSLPQVDLIFCRDCLVHLTFADAQKVIENFRKSGSKYLLTTSFTRMDCNDDLDLTGIWRPLNLQLPPFNFPEPLKLINENCPDCNGQFSDKHLCLWLLDDIGVSEEGRH